MKVLGYVTIETLVSLDKKDVTSVRTDIRKERTVTHQHPVFLSDSAVEMKKTLEYTLLQLSDALKLLRDDVPVLTSNRLRNAVHAGRELLERLKDETVQQRLEKPYNLYERMEKRP